MDDLGVPDILRLPHVSEASLLHSLRVRYGREEIYTTAGPVLLSINPYKWYPEAYSEERMLEYSSGGGAEMADTGMAADEEPHLFQVAHRAYHAMTKSASTLLLSSQQSQDQSIIISGESGAGKTEATKIIMQYLARITQKDHDQAVDSNEEIDEISLEKRVLASNPLLETFGNAKTLKNDNSSRFGKFIQIQFKHDQITGMLLFVDFVCYIVQFLYPIILKTFTNKGASIHNYLLEKTRVIHQINGERNYHIFYQLLSSKQLSSSLLLDSKQTYKYLSSASTSKPTKGDAMALEETKSSLNRIGLAEEQVSSIWAIVASVLHLGNVALASPSSSSESQEENLHCILLDESPLQNVAHLLQIEYEILWTSFTEKKLHLPNNKAIVQPLNVTQAIDKRDALAKFLFENLFVWLVRRLNANLGGSGSGESCIGILDIYGFEHFTINTLSQLLINYANESLQHQFNAYLFQQEQALYEEEGVNWEYVEYRDNSGILALLQGTLPLKIYLTT